MPEELNRILAFLHCDTPLKMAILLHKTALVNFPIATTDSQGFKNTTEIFHLRYCMNMKIFFKEHQDCQISTFSFYKFAYKKGPFKMGSIFDYSFPFI